MNPGYRYKTQDSGIQCRVDGVPLLALLAVRRVFVSLSDTLRIHVCNYRR